MMGMFKKFKNKIFLEYTAALLFEKLLKNHVIVHAHPNNAVPSWRYKGLEFPEVIELSPKTVE
jgi:hypothetical protein